MSGFIRIWNHYETKEIILSIDGNDYPIEYRKALELRKDLSASILEAKPPKHWARKIRPTRLRMPWGKYSNRLLSKVPANYLLNLVDKHLPRGRNHRCDAIKDYIDHYRPTLEVQARAERKRSCERHQSRYQKSRLRKALRHSNLRRDPLCSSSSGDSSGTQTV